MVRGCFQTICVPGIAAVMLAASASGAATWTEISSGPFRVISDTGGRAPHLRLAELDQLRLTLGAYLGKDDLDLVWPLNLVLFANQTEYAPSPDLLMETPDAEAAAWMASTPLPHDLVRAVTRQLIEDNAQRMPEAIEQGLADLMATIQIDKTNRVSLGAPPGAGELPEPRMRVWAKLQMLATQDQFSGKLRVYLNNLQQGGDEDAASRNAFSMPLAELNQRAAQYYEAGKFTATLAYGPPINPDRDFDGKKMDDSDMNDLLKALREQIKTFPDDSPRGLGAKRTRDALEDAIKANPRWAEPHDKLASLLGEPADKVRELKLATSLDLRNSDYWEDLAVAEEDLSHYGEAETAWKMAERNATNDIDRNRLHKERMAVSDRETQAAVEDKQHKISVEADDLAEVKKAFEARLHAAEEAANKRAGGTVPAGTRVVAWRDIDGQKLSGNLTNVECFKNDALRLTVQPEKGSAVKLLVNLHDLAVKGAEQANFACGVQKPPKPINLVHDGQADTQQDTIGNVHTVELP